MAPLPTIPTSFVPHTTTVTARRNSGPEFGGMFGFVAYTILAVVFALAIGIFFYGRVLAADKVAKDAELAKAEAAIDPATVTGFVQLRDRLNAGEKLLNSHVAFSGFFAVLESILPVTVRFDSLHISIDPTSGTAKIDGTGLAKSFNALSVASNAFAADGRFKDAIFSKMNINKDGSVSFGFSAGLDPKLTVFSPSGTPGSGRVATTTP